MVDQGFEQSRAGFERGLVDDETRGNVHDVFHLDQAIGLERAPGRNQIDDGVGQPGERRQFHRTVELDQIDVHALGGEVLARHVQVFGGHPQTRALFDLACVVEIMPHRHAQAATGNAQIDRQIQAVRPAAGEVFAQHVQPGHADVGTAIAHIGGHIAGAHQHHAHIGPIGRQDEFARGLGIARHRDARPRQHGQGVFENSSLGQCEGQHVGSLLAADAVADTFDLRAQAAQLDLHGVIAAVEVIDAVDHGFAFSRQRRHHQAGRGAKVGRHDGGTRELRHAMHHAGVTVDIDLRTQPHELLHMHKAILENGFCHARSAVCQAVDRHELRLHIGGKAGVFGRAHRDGARTTAGQRIGPQANPVGAGVDLGSGFAKLVEQGVLVCRLGPLHRHIAARGQGGAQKSADFDAVGNDAVRRAVQGVHALNANLRGAVAADLRAHGTQQIGEIDNLGLARRVVDQGFALGQRGGHHQVFGARHGDHVGGDARAAQPAGRRRHAGHDIAMFHRDVRPQRLQALDVLINRACADGATSGQAHPRLPESRQQGPEHQHRGAHGLDQLIRRLVVIHRCGTEADLPAVLFDLSAQAAQQLGQGTHIHELRCVVQLHRLGGEQRGGNQRQRGVLRPAGLHHALQRALPGDSEFVHDDLQLGSLALPSSTRRRARKKKGF